MIIALLFALAFGQQYQTHPSNYAFSTREAAADACVDIGMQLCSTEQLYTVAFGSVSYAVRDLCKSGWTSTTTGDYQIGWWNNDVTSCAKKVGWSAWLPASGNYAAHCCSADVGETTPTTCDSLGTCTGNKIFVDGFSSIWCPDGVCSEDVCCQDWTPADRYAYYPGRWSYDYITGEEADTACRNANDDWQLCTYEQLEGLAVDGESSCSSAWMRCRAEQTEGCVDGYRRGFWVADDDAAANACGSVAGFRTWAPSDGKGAAHCCTVSYVKSAYSELPLNGLAGAEAWCSTQPYAPNVCVAAQLETIGYTEDPNICLSGWYKETEDDTTGLVGWYQGADEIDGTVVCGGRIGWRGYVAPEPAAHCCADYVLIPDLGEFGYTPETYGTGYATGAAAASKCQSVGYDDLCTLGQIVNVGTNIQTDLCIVGWVRDGSGYDAGYFRTAEPGCGTAGAWNNGWTPATPIAFCCMNTVTEMEIATPAYYNGDWDYTYSTMAQAAAKCTGDYSLCSEDQIYTIAVHGVTYPDDNDFQIETNICRLGWTSDDSIMWWQGEETTCGAAGYRTYSSGVAGYHCCLDFPSQSPDPTTTTLGTYEGFTKAHPSYIFYTEQEAKDACTALHPDFQLCSAPQMVEVALNGFNGDGTFLPVDPQSELCFTSWVDTSRAICPEPKDIGFYRVLAGCGSSGFEWSDYRPTNPERAGAFCCAPSVVPAQEYLTELDCAPETTLPPSSAPVPTLYFPISDSVCSELGVSNCGTVYTRDNEYYLSSDDGVTYTPTCVAYSSISEASCDYSSLVCAGALRIAYGSLADQGALLAQAMAKSDSLHSACPPSPCTSYDGYEPEDFDQVVDYCSFDGCYYMNGMETCVCDASSTDVAADLQNLWETTFELSQCSDTRTFDEIMNDQLFITNQMITELESDVDSIPDVNTQLQTAQSELETIWTNWETEITATINAAIKTAENDGNQDLADSLQGIITSLDDLSTSG